MHAISVKELRSKFPFIRSELQKGESFLIIHKSKPIAELKPVNEDKTLMAMDDEEKELFEQMQRAAAEDINKYLPPLTKEEYDYYMSLAPKKD